MRRLVGLTLLVLLAWVPPVHAQLVVFDPPNFGEQIIHTGQNLLSLINQALELLPLDVIIIIDTISTDIQTLNTIIVEASQIGMDVASLEAQLNSLLDLNLAPATSSELAVRMAEIRALVWRARAYAMRVNTLIQTFQNTLRHIDMLISSIADLAGNKQNLQTLNQKAATLNYVQIVQATTTATASQAEQLDKAKELLIHESWLRIKQNVMAGY